MKRISSRISVLIGRAGKETDVLRFHGRATEPNQHIARFGTRGMSNERVVMSRRRWCRWSGSRMRVITCAGIAGMLMTACVLEHERAGVPEVTRRNVEDCIEKFKRATPSEQNERSAQVNCKREEMRDKYGIGFLVIPAGAWPACVCWEEVQHGAR